MENNKILKRFSQVKEHLFRVLLLPAALMSHAYYKAYIILRVMRGATVWTTACALTGMPMVYLQQGKVLSPSKSIRYKTKTVQKRITGR
jgi:hypothetical protein